MRSGGREHDAADHPRAKLLKAARVLHHELDRRDRGQSPSVTLHGHRAAPLPRTAALQHLHVEFPRRVDGELPPGGIRGTGPKAERLFFLGGLVAERGAEHRRIPAVQRDDAVIRLHRVRTFAGRQERDALEIHHGPACLFCAPHREHLLAGRGQIHAAER